MAFLSTSFYLFVDDRSEVGWNLSYSASKRRCLGRNQLLPQPDTYCEGHEDESTITWTNVYRAEFEAKLTKGKAMNISKFDTFLYFRKG